MQIEQMNATFGRLNGSQLDLQPGLNVICAPNESGKSTWCRFLQNMLYGVPTKERGLLADKNRYAPWSGSPMQGRLLLRSGDARYTLLRETRRTTAPMGDARLTYTGTAVRVGSVAVDPRYIPYGTRMFIVSDDGCYIYGLSVAEDCGGAIKRDRIDLYFPTYDECIQFGRRNCTIYFLS